METRLGFIGLGMMGSRMCGRLLARGFAVSVWNRTRERANALIEQGARWCDSAQEVSADSDVVISMLSTPDVVSAVAVEVRKRLRHGGVHIDCSTISPGVTSDLAADAKRAGTGFVHAPVLGSVAQVIDGTLLIFAGGDSANVERVMPVLRALGSSVFVFERAEQATNTKLLCNFFIAAMAGTLAQGLVFARSAGIDQRVFLDILSRSALNAPMYQTKGAAMIARDFTPRFYVEHMAKDVRLMADASAALGITLPYLNSLGDAFSRAVDAGLSRQDYSAVLDIFEQMALNKPS